jgi:hypothetical protein
MFEEVDVMAFGSEEFKKALRKVLREELTSGDEAVSELVNEILKAIRDKTQWSRLDNLDVLLSTRASESTLSAIKTQTDKLTFDTSNRLAIQNPPNLDVALSTRASEATLKTLRWGRDVSPAWVHGDEVTAPAAGTALVSKTVSTGKSGYVYGFFISAGEANDFKINWTSDGAAKSVRIPLASKGAVQYVDLIALNEGMPADGGSSITITNVNAGSSGIVYQARILYVEV